MGSLGYFPKGLNQGIDSFRVVVTREELSERRTGLQSQIDALPQATARARTNILARQDITSSRRQKLLRLNSKFLRNRTEQLQTQLRRVDRDLNALSRSEQRGTTFAEEKKGLRRRETARERERLERRAQLGDRRAQEILEQQQEVRRVQQAGLERLRGRPPTTVVRATVPSPPLAAPPTSLLAPQPTTVVPSAELRRGRRGVVLVQTGPAARTAGELFERLGGDRPTRVTQRFVPPPEGVTITPGTTREIFERRVTARTPEEARFAGLPGPGEFVITEQRITPPTAPPTTIGRIAQFVESEESRAQRKLAERVERGGLQAVPARVLIGVSELGERAGRGITRVAERGERFFRERRLPLLAASFAPAQFVGGAVTGVSRDIRERPITTVILPAVGGLAFRAAGAVSATAARAAGVSSTAIRSAGTGVGLTLGGVFVGVTGVEAGRAVRDVGFSRAGEVVGRAGVQAVSFGAGAVIGGVAARGVVAAVRPLVPGAPGGRVGTVGGRSARVRAGRRTRAELRERKRERAAVPTFQVTKETGRTIVELRGAFRTKKTRQARPLRTEFSFVPITQQQFIRFTTPSRAALVQFRAPRGFARATRPKGVVGPPRVTEVLGPGERGPRIEPPPPRQRPRRPSQAPERRVTKRPRKTLQELFGTKRTPTARSETGRSTTQKTVQVESKTSQSSRKPQRRIVRGRVTREGVQVASLPDTVRGFRGLGRRRVARTEVTLEQEVFREQPSLQVGKISGPSPGSQAARQLSASQTLRRLRAQQARQRARLERARQRPREFLRGREVSERVRVEQLQSTRQFFRQRSRQFQRGIARERFRLATVTGLATSQAAAQVTGQTTRQLLEPTQITGFDTPPPPPPPPGVGGPGRGRGQGRPGFARLGFFTTPGLPGIPGLPTRPPRIPRLPTFVGPRFIRRSTNGFFRRTSKLAKRTSFTPSAVAVATLQFGQRTTKEEELTGLVFRPIVSRFLRRNTPSQQLFSGTGRITRRTQNV